MTSELSTNKLRILSFLLTIYSSPDQWAIHQAKVKSMTIACLSLWAWSIFLLNWRSKFKEVHKPISEGRHDSSWPSTPILTLWERKGGGEANSKLEGWMDLVSRCHGEDQEEEKGKRKMQNKVFSHFQISHFCCCTFCTFFSFFPSQWYGSFRPPSRTRQSSHRRRSCCLIGARWRCSRMR